MSEQLFSSLDSGARAWSAWMWPMAWQLSVLVALLALLTWLLRHRSARLRYALWLLVPIRLALPPTLALATGWGWWVLPTEGVTVARQETDVVATETTGGTELSVDSAVGERPPVTFQPHGFNSISPLIMEPRVLEADAQARARVTAADSSTWQRWLFVGWIVGVVLLMMRLIHGSFRAARMIRRSTVPRDSRVIDLAEKCRGRMGLRRSVAVRQLADADVPMLIGILRPTIILPADIHQRLTSQELEAVLIHELHHVARHDTLANVMQTVLGIVYFFHPLVWIANRFLRHLREDACDEATVAMLAGQRRAYGSGIVKVAEMATGRRPSVALGVAESGSQVKRRLRRILDPRLPLGRRLSWSREPFCYHPRRVLASFRPRRPRVRMMGRQAGNHLIRQPASRPRSTESSWTREARPFKA